MNHEQSVRLAIDVGGTFTDIAVLDDANGTIMFGKILSTPDDPSIGSVDGARQVLEAHGIPASNVRDMIHATTIATNAVLERKGAATGLVTTEGFRDTLEIGRENRYDIYDLELKLPEPLIERRHRAEVKERLGCDGEVVTPLDEASVESAFSALRDAGIQSVAVCLLHAFSNPDHEKRIAEIARSKFSDMEISVSSEVANEIREFERTSTVAVDAYVKPLVRRYIEKLEDDLRDLGVQNKLALMLSNGGIGAARQVAASYPVRMIESGPAAGAACAAFVATKALESADAVSFDMGGTTAKMAIIRGGVPAVTHEYEVAHVHRFKKGSGIPLQLSAVELLEIGAGGGSIAHLNKLGLLTVGPHSAGAKPGPACYGLGGEQPTITDADLVLGYLNPDFFLGGDLKLDRDAAKNAIATKLGGKLGMSVEAIAWGIHDIVNEQMAAAVRAHAAEMGADLRTFGLIAFGGAGPVHAYAVARRLGIKRVIYPFGAGVGSAIGCLVAEPAVDLVVSYPRSLNSVDWDDAAGRFETMRASGAEVVGSLAGESAKVSLLPQFEMRCEGQGYSVVVSMPEDAPINAALAEALRAEFLRSYLELYGHEPPAVPLELANLRARVVHRQELPDLRLRKPAADAKAGVRKGERPVYFEQTGGFTSTMVYDRYGLEVGEIHQGPAIIEERETSIVIGPDTDFFVDESGNIVVDLKS